MSRGWESKSVEGQQEQQQASQQVDQHAIDRNTAVGDRRAASLADAEKKRRLQALEMQRERILSERTSSPHRRSALENALADIEERLAELGWTIHL